MPVLAELTRFSPAAMLMVFGAVAVYVGSRAAADALARGAERGLVGRLALGHWGPIALVAAFAVSRGRADVAAGVVLGSAVGALSLALGMVTYLSPPGPLPGSRRAWPFVLAGALLVLIAGFSGHLSAVHAAMLLLLGFAVLNVWRGATADDIPVARVLADLADPPAAGAPAAGPDRPADWGLRVAQGVLAVALSAAGARALVGGAVAIDGASRYMRVALLAAGVLSPLLILPTLATGTDLAQRNRSGEAAGTYVALALLNLFALLPATILMWYVRSAAAAWPPPAGQPRLAGFVSLFQPLPLPLTVWRVDVVLLAVLGFALVPISLGRWAIGRLESMGLVFVYAFYLAVTAAASVRG